jgi:hemerythrin-like domain-containing protein
MTPTDQLREEHDGILLMLRILEEICARLKKNGSVDPVHLEAVLEFLKVFVDTCHHGKEEDLLFPEMEKLGVPKDPGPIGVMLSEHNRGRANIRAMTEAVSRVQEPGAHISEFLENATNYIALLRAHIQKENNVLFPLGEKILPGETQERLAERFEELERERIGEGRHEEFHRVLHRLQEIYLQKA